MNIAVKKRTRNDRQRKKKSPEKKPSSNNLKRVQISSDAYLKLDQKTHEQIYRKIENNLFQGTHSVSHPRVVIMGGQPGSGKSKLLEASRELFSDGNVIVINGDELREYHPRSEEIFKLDEKLYAEKTNADSRYWTKRVFDRASETKRNIIFESTTREAGPISETMKRLLEGNQRGDGYK